MLVNEGDVIFSVEPWIRGTCAAGYCGPLFLKRTITGKSWEEGISTVLDEAAQIARDRSCNALVGIEIDCDPYHLDGGHIEFKGTLAKLESLFPEIPLEVAP